MKRKERTYSREEYAALIQTRKVTPAYLYEQQHNTDGSEFAYAQITPTYTRYIRIWPKQENR